LIERPLIIIIIIIVITIISFTLSVRNMSEYANLGGGLAYR